MDAELVPAFAVLQPQQTRHADANNRRLRAGFGTEVAAVAEALVPLTLALWNRVQAKLLPTPAKFHYLFNVRELSKVRLLINNTACTSLACCPSYGRLFDDAVHAVLSISCPPCTAEAELGSEHIAAL